MNPKTDLDYVELYAEKLRNDNSLFSQHKKFIESQMKISSELCRKRFGNGDDFEIKARKYLKEIGLI